jgi:hypothetical protein
MSSWSRERLPLEDIVRAQNMACAGASIADIALELGYPAQRIAMLLDPEAAPPARRRTVTVGYAHIKERYR